MFELIQRGGFLMWPILIASAVALTIFFERWLFFRRQDLKAEEFLAGIINLVQRRQYQEALDRCEEAYGPVAQVVHAAIKHHNLPKSELREIVQEVAQLQMPRLEQHLSTLATLGYLTPLIGLLGTITGMISVFMTMQAKSGTATAGDLSGGIWEALLTAAAGLCVAIPTYAAYNFLVTRLNHFMRDMERAGIEIVQALSEKGVRSEQEIQKQNREVSLASSSL
ncbi:MAG: MotA/TolQ/ExbB proton channel family protein [Verrucomicrobiae bacterium]|nr:MotA/TolQ/ExbB proton channel family protein [Verrucomicrobiae bacterium]